MTEQPNIKPVHRGSCGMCAYAFSQPDGGMHCRRNPPTAFITPQGQGSIFPPTQPSHWCGEWKMGLPLGAPPALDGIRARAS